MAKFKVGDKVETVYTTGVGKIEKETIDAFTGKKHYKVVFSGGLRVDADERDLTLANSSPITTNPVVANALAAKNDAYTDFKEFKFFKTCAMHEISNAKIDIAQRAKTLESDFKQSLTRTTKESEKDYITTCYEKCKAALKEAYDRLRKQEANVMA